MEIGDEYSKLHKTIVILIADFELKEMKGIEELGTRWAIMLDNEEKRMLTEKLEIRILEIPKARRILEKNEKDEIAQWLMFLDNPNSMEVSKIMKENEEIKEAIEDLEDISQDYELRRIAELKEKYRRDEKATYAKGLEDGEERGREEGRAEGVAQNKREIAKKMLNAKMDINTIIEMTGLTKKEIENLT